MELTGISKYRVRNFTWASASKAQRRSVERQWRESGTQQSLANYRAEFKQKANQQIAVNRKNKLANLNYKIASKWIGDVGNIGGDTRNISEGLKLKTAQIRNVKWTKNSQGEKVTYTIPEKEYRREYARLNRWKNMDASDITRKQIKRLFPNSFLKQAGVQLKGNRGSTIIQGISNATDSADFYKDNRDLIMAYNNKGKDKFSSDEGKILSIIYNDQLPEAEIQDFQDRLRKHGGDFDKLLDDDEDYIKHIIKENEERHKQLESKMAKAGFGK